MAEIAALFIYQIAARAASTTRRRREGLSPNILFPRIPQRSYVNDTMAGGIGRTAVELGAVILAGAENHATAAVGTRRRDSCPSRRMALPEISDMVGLALFANTSTAFSDCLRNRWDLRWINLHSVERPDVVHKPSSIHHAIRPWRLEGAFFGERHHAMQIIL